MTEPMQRFLVDNNALFSLTSEERTSAKFRDIVRLPSEVIQEAGPYVQREHLDRLDFPMTAAVLRHLKSVMATVDPVDRSLVDLFHYEGTADPILVACALAANEAPEGLMAVQWTVVTADDAVLAKCEEFNIPRCSAATFSTILSDSN